MNPVAFTAGTLRTESHPRCRVTAKRISVLGAKGLIFATAPRPTRLLYAVVAQLGGLTFALGARKQPGAAFTPVMIAVWIGAASVPIRVAIAARVMAMLNTRRAFL